MQDKSQAQRALAEHVRFKRQAPLRKMAREEELAHEREMMKVRNPSVTQEPLVWRGTKRSFGDWVQKAYDNNNLEGKTRNHALEMACEHFVDHKGKRMNPRSILQNLKNRSEREGK